MDRARTTRSCFLLLAGWSLLLVSSRPASQTLAPRGAGESASTERERRLGVRPSRLAVLPDGTRAYVLNEADGRISILDIEQGRVVGRLRWGEGLRSPSAPAPFLSASPDSAYLFVGNPVAGELLVFDAAGSRLAGRIRVPKGCTAIAVDPTSPTNRVLLVNTVRNELLVLDELAPGAFSAQARVPLQGRGPTGVASLPGGLVAVGHADSREIEFLDPGGSPTTLARTALPGRPLALAVDAGKLFVTTFVATPGVMDGRSEVLELDLVTHALVGAHLTLLGADYFAADARDGWLAVAASGSGSVLVADAATGGLLQRIDLAPGDPVANPRDLVLVPDPGLGSAQELYVVDFFRETVRPVLLGGGPPFALGREIPIGTGPRARIPRETLTDLETGEWLFSTVAAFNGDAAAPNTVTCLTCHPRGGSDGNQHLQSLSQAPPLFGTSQTGPWSTTGGVNFLFQSVNGALAVHNHTGKGNPADALFLLNQFLVEVLVDTPESPWLRRDGSLTPAAEAGQVVFENQGSCVDCHTAPLFIPVSPMPKTILGGVGTGVAPINVPSLRGLWTTAPYFKDGSASTLLDVLLRDTGDLHGTTSALDAQEREDLVAYLLTL